MIGTLPSELRHLANLRTFGIQHNDGIVGTIPFQYGWLDRLSNCELVHHELAILPRKSNYEPLDNNPK